MYSQEINQYLIARLLAIQKAFSQNGSRYNSKINRNSHLQTDTETVKIITSEKGRGEEEGGGGGTARGLRTNPLQRAKEALRRMTRSK